ncbi:MAG: hypothetical protein QE271_11825 [Bacteriovoracaceae bacterium]|nr:hypothetical protein [Bacteriovoracaceae bacterium]
MFTKVFSLLTFLLLSNQLFADPIPTEKIEELTPRQLFFYNALVNPNSPYSEEEIKKLLEFNLQANYGNDLEYFFTNNEEFRLATFNKSLANIFLQNYKKFEDFFDPSFFPAVYKDADLINLVNKYLFLIKNISLQNQATSLKSPTQDQAEKSAKHDFLRKYGNVYGLTWESLENRMKYTPHLQREYNSLVAKYLNIKIPSTANVNENGVNSINHWANLFKHEFQDLMFKKIIEMNKSLQSIFPDIDKNELKIVLQEQDKNSNNPNLWAFFNNGIFELRVSINDLETFKIINYAPAGIFLLGKDNKNYQFIVVDYLNSLHKLFQKQVNKLDFLDWSQEKRNKIEKIYFLSNTLNQLKIFFQLDQQGNMVYNSIENKLNILEIKNHKQQIEKRYVQKMCLEKLSGLRFSPDTINKFPS